MFVSTAMLTFSVVHKAELAPVLSCYIASDVAVQEARQNNVLPQASSLPSNSQDPRFSWGAAHIRSGTGDKFGVAQVARLHSTAPSINMMLFMNGATRGGNRDRAQQRY